MGRKERHLVGLDLGTSKVAAIVGEVMGNGEVEIIGLGVAESQGIRRGAVVNQEAAVESIRKAVEAAELTAGIEIDNAYVSLSGTHIKGFNSRGVVAVAGRNREITRDDVRRAIDAARAVSLPGGREILHVLPQDFVVDDEDGIGNPIGMTGARLEVNVHIVTGGATTTQNIVSCVNKAGVNVQESVLEQLAASEAVLTPDEKELGVAVVDIGGGTTDLAISSAGSSGTPPWCPSAAITSPATSPSASACRSRRPSRRCGAPLRPRPWSATTRPWTWPASAAGRPARWRGGSCPRCCSRAPRRCATSCGTRFTALATRSRCNSGIVLTGGGADLDGMVEIAEQIFDMPVRLGTPPGLGGLADHVGSPSFATAVGLLLRAHRLRAHEGGPEGLRPRDRPADRASARVCSGNSSRTRWSNREANVEAWRSSMPNPDRATTLSRGSTRSTAPLRMTMDDAAAAGARIKVIGVGGGGGNAVNRMIARAARRGVHRRQHRRAGPAHDAAPSTIQIGEKLTTGLGSGGDPGGARRRRSRTRAGSSPALDGADMVFITAGMGGGTGHRRRAGGGAPREPSSGR